MLGHKLHSGTSKMKAGQGRLVRVTFCDFDICTMGPDHAKGLFAVVDKSPDNAAHVNVSRHAFFISHFKKNIFFY